LIILKAFFDAGRPSHGKAPLGSFVEWDGVVRAAVWFSTGVDCLDTQRAASIDSPERRQKLSLLAAWKALPDQKHGLTCAEVCRLASLTKDEKPVHQDLFDTLLELGWKGKIIEIGRLGYKVRSMKNEIVEGLRFQSTGENRAHQTMWSAIEVY